MIYKNNAKKFIESKYRNTPIKNIKFINDYSSSRKKFKSQIINTRNFEIIVQYDKTTKEFYKIFKKKKFNKRDEFYLIKMYKKFEVNLNLKTNYRKFKKKSNKMISTTGLIVFGLLVCKLKILNKLQKLNFLLKLNDLILIQNLKLDKFQKKNLHILLHLEKTFFNFYRKR